MLGKSSLVSCLLFALVGCATLAPKNVRQVEKEFTSSMNKKKTYQRALVWFSAGPDTKVTFENHLQFYFNGEGMGQCIFDSLTPATLKFKFSFTVNENGYRLRFSDLQHFSFKKGILGPSDKEYVERLERDCLSSLEKRLSAEINK